jgi:hypothetical protein
MINNLSLWKKKHRNRTDFGQFKNRSHPIRKMKHPDKTVYYCIQCRVYFTVYETNKIKAPKKKIWKKHPEQKTDRQIATAKLDKIWIKYIKARAGHRSELSGRGPHTMDFLHAHHIHGKSTMLLRYSLNNGICVTGEEHSTKAHGTAEAQAAFKEFAIDKRNADDHLILNEFDCGDFDEIEAYLKENLKLLKEGGAKEPEDQQEVYFP